MYLDADFILMILEFIVVIGMFTAITIKKAKDNKKENIYMTKNLFDDDDTRGMSIEILGNSEDVLDSNIGVQNANSSILEEEKTDNINQ